MNVHKASIIAAVLAVCVGGAQAQQTQKPTAPGQGTTAKPSPTQGASGAQSKTSSVASSDRTFMMKAAEDGHKEIALAQVAQSKASAPSVKALADRLLKDHQQADQELTTLAQSKGVTLTSKADHKGDPARLEKLEGAAFDRSYSQMMVQDHNTAIKLFQQASNSKDSEVKAFADKTLPTLREHLKMAQDALGSTKTSTSGTAGQKPATGQKPSAGDRPSTGERPAGGEKPAGGPKI